MIGNRRLEAKITHFRVNVVNHGPDKSKLLGWFDCDWGFLKVCGCALFRSKNRKLFVATPFVRSSKTVVHSVTLSKTALRYLKIDAFEAFRTMGGVE